MPGPRSARRADHARQPRSSWVERVIVSLALLTCFLFVAQLEDTRSVPAPVRTQSLPSAPVLPPAWEGIERHSKLQVTVRECIADTSTDAGEAPQRCFAGPAVSGARVRAFWLHRARRGEPSYVPVGSATTDAQGRGELGSLPRGVLWLLAEAPSAGLGRASTQLVLDSEADSTEIVLPHAQSLKVRVSDELGRPLEGATVLATSADPLPFGALTDAKGEALLDRLGTGPWTVKASAQGHESITRAGVSGSFLELSLRRLSSLEVLVENPDGSPAENAVVVVSGSSLWPARQTTTGEGGSVLIGGLLSGAYDVRASKGSKVSVTVVGLQLDRGARLTITLRLEQGRMVTAIVTDGQGDNPPLVANADVLLVEGGLSSFPLQGRTGADGSVTLGPIPAGRATLSARADGFVARAAVPVPDPLDGPVQIPLLRGATLLGEVVDADGHPVDGASIELIGTDLDGMPVADTPQLLAFRQTHFQWALPGPAPLIPAGELGVMPGPIPPIPDSWPPRLPTSPTAPIGDAEITRFDPWVTRADGSFKAHPVTPGRIRALVRHPDYVEGISEPVTLGPGGEASVKVVLLAGGTMEGKVVDHRGYAVPGARVDVIALQGTFERTTLTASDGSFAFAAVPGRVLVNVYRPEDYQRVVVEERLDVPGGERVELELELPPPRDPVVVKVVDDTGHPVDVAQVSFLSLDPAVPLRKTYFTGPEGRVELEDSVGLKLEIRISAPGWARSVQRFDEAPEQVDVELQPAVQVEGRITAVRGRRFVSGASVTLVSGGERRSALTDDDGGYRIKDVSPGLAKLLVSHPEYARAQVSVRITRTGHDSRPLELQTVNLELPGVLEGRVLDLDGSPVVAARVAIGVAPAFLPVGALPPGVAVTDVQGRFVLRGVPEGEVELEAYAADVGRGRSPKVTVDSTRPTTDIEIRLDEEAGDVEPAATGSIAVTLGDVEIEEERFVAILQVAEGSEAERADLRVDDLLLSVDGLEVSDMVEARKELSGPVRSDVVLVVERDGERETIRVKRERVRR